MTATAPRLSHPFARFLAMSLLALGLLAFSNYLASLALFALHLESPVHAGFFSIERALMVAADRNAYFHVALSIAAGLFFGTIVPISCLLRYLRRKAAASIHGMARFATWRDLRSGGQLGNKGLLTGRFKNHYLTFPGAEFLLLAAPTRSGKGVGFCIPNLLTYPDSVVVLDIKGENYNITANVRRYHLGQEVHYFDPYSEGSVRWNPLDYVSRDPRYRVVDLMLIASVIFPDRPEDKDPFWRESSRNLFIGLALLVIETPELPQTLGEILRQSSGKGHSIGAYLRHVILVRERIGDPLSLACQEALNRFLNTGDQTMLNILATFAAPLAIFANPIVDKATSASDFDLRTVRKTRQSIYITVPPNNIGQAAFLLNLFFSQLINENVRTLPENDPSLQHQCLLLLDEFTAVGRINILAKGVGFIAGYNLRLAIVIQDRSQLESTYGKEDAHNLIANMGTVIYYTPAQVNEAEMISKHIGNTSVEGLSTSYSNIGWFKIKPSRSETFQMQAKPLISTQDLLLMSQEKELVVKRGQPVAMADKIYYFREKRFTQLLDRYGRQSQSMPAAYWDSYWESLHASAHYLRPEFSAEQLGGNAQQEDASPLTPPELTDPPTLAQER